jgi:O-antigen/teichoic acid export membrane protein
MPVYIRLIGVESYGLVAFYTSLTGALAILDLGLSTSISRQLSIMRANGTSLGDQRTLLFSIERVYWGIAIFLGLSIVLLAYPIATYWVNSKDLSVSVIQNAVMLMGIAFAFQWPNAIYVGSLTGLQKQSRSAVIGIIYSTLRALMLVLVLKFINSTIEMFFAVQIIMTFLQSTMYRSVTWKQLSLAGHRPKFSREHLLQVKKFAVGVTGISIVSFALTQIDKLVVSKMVLLEFVGYYNLAFVLANIMITVISPMQTVFFPKFSAMVASNQQQQLTDLFHKTARWISIIVIPMGCLFVIFSKEILFLWTKNAVLTEHTAPILRFAAIGTVCNCLMWVPYFYMLAKGITRYTIYQNIIGSLVLTPLLFWWTGKYGAVGASLVWFTVNVGYVLISIPIFHQLYFKGNLAKWYLNNLVKPVFIAGSLALLTKEALDKLDYHYTYLSFGLVLIFLGSIYGMITKEIREYIFALGNKKFKLL